LEKLRFEEGEVKTCLLSFGIDWHSMPSVRQQPPLCHQAITGFDVPARICREKKFIAMNKNHFISDRQSMTKILSVGGKVVDRSSGNGSGVMMVQI